MKKITSALACALLLTSLAGCTDAQAKLKDSDTVLITIGNKTITKGEVYSVLNTTYGASAAITNANKVIASSEVEATEDMIKSAEETLENYKALYGDTFTKYLEQSGMTEEDYKEQLILSLQAEQLSKNYISDHYDELAARYTPVKAVILEFTSSDDSEAALVDLNSGSKTAAEAAEEHNSSSTGTPSIYTTESSSLDAMVRSVLFSMTEEDGWANIPASDGSAYILVHVEENDPEALKEEASDVFLNLSTVSDDANVFYFTKYGFHIYDKTLYDGVSADYPEYLVQDIKADESKN